MGVQVRRAVVDDRLRARVVGAAPLLYAEGADAALDRPAHVRAASGIVRVGRQLVVVQDDANFLAVIDPASGRVSAVTLPAGPDGRRQFDDVRGTKHLKLDLECAVVVPRTPDGPVLLAFGSGSTEMRERIVVVRGAETGEPVVRVVHAPALYTALRAETAFVGSELNVEGAVWVDGAIRLFNRGNGAPRGGMMPVDATCDVRWDVLSRYLADAEVASEFTLDNVTRYDLGAVDGCRLTFTDAAAVGGAVMFAATAEDSPDAVRDGPVAGSAIGVVAADGSVRLALVTGPEGERLTEKVEGICPDPDDATRLLAVVDRDDPAVPSELLTLELSGDWRERS
jgi:hypothetical protein